MADHVSQSAASMPEGSHARLDREVRELGSARRRLLARIAALLLELRRGRHFVALGYGSLTDYAEAVLGFSTRKTRDLVELAERGEVLPRIRGAFEAGMLHWTKLRTIARVATSESEGEWLERAERMSSRELELAVAKVKGDGTPRLRVVLELTGEQSSDFRARRVARGCATRNWPTSRTPSVP